MNKRTKDLIIRGYRKYVRDNNYTQLFDNFGIDPLYVAYAKPSRYKAAAWSRIRDIDRDAVIISYNSQFFTAGYIDTDPESGEAYFIIDTGRNRYGAPVAMLDQIIGPQSNWIF